MITCETSGMRWTVEGKIESIDGTYGGDGAHVGIDDLSRLLSEHVGKWARVRVELIEGPRPPNEVVVDEDLKRMRALAKRVRDILALLRALPVETSGGTRRYGYAPEEGLAESTAETMLFVCDRIEELLHRLRELEASAK